MKKKYYEHKCNCRCKRKIEIQKHHKYTSVPNYILRHNSRGKNNPMFGKKGKDNPNFGQKRPNQSEKMRGHTVTKRTKRKISEGHKGKIVSEETRKKIRINTNFAKSPGIISHEQGHGFIVPRGHSLSIPPEKTIMNESLVLIKPSEIDCKAGKLIYETNYTVIDSEFPRYLGEHQKNILGLEFGVFD